jgi:type IV secretion system protein VirD4
MNQPPPNSKLGLSAGESTFAYLIGITFGVAFSVYITGELSGILFHFNRPGAGIAEAPKILFNWFTTLGNPKNAWPIQYRQYVANPVLFYSLYLIILIAGAFLFKFGKELFTGKLFKKKDGNVASWAKNKDIKSLIVKGPSRGRLVLGKVNNKVIATEPRQSVIVLGPTQTGKTTGFAVPSILEWDGPVVAASVKNDLVKDTYKWRKTQGDVWLFDPTRSTGSEYDEVWAGWSPLSAAKDWGGARKVSSWLCSASKSKGGGGLENGDFWMNAAEKMMSPFLFAAAVGGKDMGTVLKWIDTNEESEILKILAKAGVSEATTAFNAHMGRDEKTKSSILTTAETIIDAYADPMVCESAKNPKIFPSELLNGGKNTLYLCAPSHEQARLQPIFTALVALMKSSAYELSGKISGPIDPPLLMVIDEAANIAPLEDLDAIASTAAGIGIQLVTIFQDMAQIEARYKEKARTVVNNHRAKIILSGISDTGTLEYVSKICGDEEVDQSSTSISAQGERSTTESKQSRNLATGSLLRKMKFGEGIVVYGSLAPAKLKLRMWFNDPRLTSLTKGKDLSGMLNTPNGGQFSYKKKASLPEMGSVIQSPNSDTLTKNELKQPGVAPGAQTPLPGAQSVPGYNADGVIANPQQPLDQPSELPSEASSQFSNNKFNSEEFTEGGQFSKKYFADKHSASEQSSPSSVKKEEEEDPVSKIPSFKKPKWS